MNTMVYPLTVEWLWSSKTSSCLYFSDV